jgi:tetratricopeptide (TPR) repeat protein
LRFVVDAIVLEHAKEADTMRAWGKTALDEIRKSDPMVPPDAFLAISRSLVAAVDIREKQYLTERVTTNDARQRLAGAKTDDEKRAITAELARFKQSLDDESTLELYEDYQKGAVFAFYFADELKGVEDSGFDIANSLKEMIVGFDGSKETSRLASTADARRRAIAGRADRKKNPQTTSASATSPVVTRLTDIQKTIDARDYAKADADLKTLLVSYPREPRIYYNIGRVAGLTAVGLTEQEQQIAKLHEAQNAYVNVLNFAGRDTDPALVSLTYVALARIYEFANENDYALKLYEKAIEIGDVPASGFKDAMAAKQRLVKPNP